MLSSAFDKRQTTLVTPGVQYPSSQSDRLTYLGLPWDHSSFLRWVTSPIVHPSILRCILKTTLWIWHKSIKQHFMRNNAMEDIRSYKCQIAKLFRLLISQVVLVVRVVRGDGLPSTQLSTAPTCPKALSKSSLLNTPPYLGDLVCTGWCWFKPGSDISSTSDLIRLTSIVCIKPMTKTYWIEPTYIIQTVEEWLISNPILLNCFLWALDGALSASLP